MKLLLTLVSVTLLFSAITGCKKEKHATPVVSPTPCTSTIYGYYGAINDDLYGPVAPYMFGTFNPSSATSTGIATINTHIRFGDAAYNTSDNCYYGIIGGSNSPTLCKVSTAGVVTYYTLPSGTHAFIGNLVYSTSNNKLLALQNDSAITKLSEIVISSGSTYSVTPITTIPLPANVTEIVSDPYSGDIYAVSISNTTPYNYTLSKITTAGTTSVDSGSGAITSLRYNTSDNMIYALHYSSTQPYALVKIDPSGGHTALADLPVHFNSDFYSTCLDDCNGRYIVSTLKYDSVGSIWDESHGKIYQFDLSGSLLQQDNTPGLFQGLVVKH